MSPAARAQHLHTLGTKQLCMSSWHVQHDFDPFKPRLCEQAGLRSDYDLEALLIAYPDHAFVLMNMGDHLTLAESPEISPKQTSLLSLSSTASE